MKKKEQTLHQLGHEPVVQFFHRIRGAMIVGVAEKSGICNHDRFESLVPERGMVTEPDSRKDPPVEWNPYFDYGKFRVILKCFKNFIFLCLRVLVAELLPYL
jgi:hypothetical protein